MTQKEWEIALKNVVKKQFMLLTKNWGIFLFMIENNIQPGNATCGIHLLEVVSVYPT